MWKLTLELPFVSRKKYQGAMRAWASCADTVGELMDEVDRLLELNDNRKIALDGAMVGIAALRRDLRECQRANADLRADLDAARARIAELSSPDTVTLLANAEALCGCSSELWSDAAAEVVP